MGPRETQSDLAEAEIWINTGDRLARARRISAEDHGTITRKIRGELDDARYHIKKILFAQRCEINGIPPLKEMRLFGSDPNVSRNSNMARFKYC